MKPRQLKDFFLGVRELFDGKSFRDPMILVFVSFVMRFPRDIMDTVQTIACDGKSWATNL